jgi:hypothetical protein
MKFLKIISFLFFLIVLLIALFHHEFWRDELQAFSLVNASTTFLNLYENTRFEGHPIGWFTFLFGVIKIIRLPEILLLINFCVGFLVAYLVIFKSPFKIRQAIIILLGYYFIFEYGALCRNYYIGIALLFLFCSFQKKQKINFWQNLILIFLLTQFSIYGAILALPITFYFIQRNKKSLSWKLIVVLIFVLLFGEIISIVSCLPSQGNTFSPLLDGKFTIDNFILSLETIWKGILPIPNLKTNHFWNSNILETKHRLQALLSVLILVICCINFYKNKLVFYTFLIGVFLLLGFTYFQFIGFSRHSGHYYILLLACWWLMKTENDSIKRGSYSNNLCFNFLILVHCIIGVLFFYTDYKKPFSNASNCANFIASNYLDGTLCGSTDDAVSAVAGNLGQPIIYLNNFKRSTYVIWNKDRTYPNDSLIIQNIFKVAHQYKKLVLVLNYKPQKNWVNILPEHQQQIILQSDSNKINCKHLKSFTGAIVEDENFDLYTITWL